MVLKLSPSQSPEKKGTRSWRPAERLRTINKLPGFVYRWCDKDQLNLAKREADGWFYASKLTGHSDVGQEEPENRPMTTITEYRELVLMAIPDDEYAAHRAYYDGLTRKQTVGLKKDLEQKVRGEAATSGIKSADIYGKIVIE